MPGLAAADSIRWDAVSLHTHSRGSWAQAPSRGHYTRSINGVGRFRNIGSQGSSHTPARARARNIGMAFRCTEEAASLSSRTNSPSAISTPLLWCCGTAHLLWAARTDWAASASTWTAPLHRYSFHLVAHNAVGDRARLVLRSAPRRAALTIPTACVCERARVHAHAAGRASLCDMRSAEGHAHTGTHSP